MRRSFATTAPFPHAVLDDFFPLAVAERLEREFPPLETFFDESTSGDPRRRGKYSSTAETPLPPFLRGVLEHLTSRRVLSFLTRLSGIRGLTSDPDVRHALRHYATGGRLGLHADGSYHGILGLDRRLNLLIYVTSGWRPEWGGALELWHPDLSHCDQRIECRFNRAVVFATDDRSIHGFPEPLGCPPGVTRRSLNLYYYTRGRPAGEAAGRHGTIFMEEGPQGPRHPPRVPAGKR